MDSTGLSADLTASKPGDSRHQGLRKREARSRVSNGVDILPDVDGRSIIARRYRDIMSAIIIDQGGADRISETRLQLIRRFAAAACIAEQREAALARGEQIDVSEHALLCSTLVRVAQRIGINEFRKRSCQRCMSTCSLGPPNETADHITPCFV